MVKPGSVALNRNRPGMLPGIVIVWRRSRFVEKTIPEDDGLRRESECLGFSVQIAMFGIGKARVMIARMASE